MLAMFCSGGRGNLMLTQLTWGKDNTYSFKWDGKRIIVMPSEPTKTEPKEEGKALLSVASRRDEFEDDLKTTKAGLCLVVKGEEQPLQPIHEEVRGLLVEFEDAMKEPKRLHSLI